MAARYYGVAVGGDRPTDVTEGTSTTSSAFEFVVANTTATRVNKLTALKALEAIRDQIVQANKWPPA